MQELNWQYPSWFLLFCITLGIAAAVFLYRKDTTFRDQSVSLRTLMAVLRGLTVTVISALLLAPLLKWVQTRNEPPIVIIAEDQSASIRKAFSTEDSIRFQEGLEKMISTLAGKYNVQKIGFGENITTPDTFTWNEQATDMGQFMTYVKEQYSGQHIGAIVMASDGAINKGRNPLYIPLQQKAPFHSIALGDTTIHTDAQIREVFHNSISYLGDKFIAQIDVSAMRLNGSSATLEVKHIKGTQQILVQSIPLKIEGDSWFQTQEVTIESKEAGVQRYRAEITRLPGEVSTANNSRDFFVEVIDGRLKVLMVANSPHPDLGAWKNALQLQRNYEVEIKMASEFKVADLKEVDLVVLHQLPSQSFNADAIFNAINNAGLSRVFVVGAQTDLNRFNGLQNVIKITAAQNRSANDVTPQLNPGFTAFNTNDDLKSKLPGFTPLQAPYGEYSISPGAQVFAYQKIGQVETQFPLITMMESQGVRSVVLAGEGIWKWQLFEQLQYGSKENTSELIGQLSQYASTKSDKRKFRVNMPKKVFSEIEDISFQAELYTDNYELINTPDVNMKIKNADGQSFDFLFTPAGESYQLKIGRFPEGDYSFDANTELNGVKHSFFGKFAIQPVRLEQLTTTADHGILRQLSTQYSGQVFLPGQLEELTSTLMNDENLKPVMYATTQTQPLIHLKWLCLALLGLLGLEWFLRRYFGGY